MVLVNRIRQIDQWDRIDTQELNSYIYSQLIFDTGVKTNQWERTVFVANGVEIITYTCKNIPVDL